MAIHRRDGGDRLARALDHCAIRRFALGRSASERDGSLTGLQNDF
jgi:hypothetical protein